MPAQAPEPVTESSRRTFPIVAAGTLLLIVVWEHVEATRLGYQVERSRQQVYALEGRISGLRMQLEGELSPFQLAEHARARLGMVPAGPECVRVLDQPEAPAADSFIDRLLTRSRRGLSLLRT